MFFWLLFTLTPLYARREVCSGTPDVDELLHRELRAEFRPRGLEARHSATAGHCGRRQPERCGEGFSHSPMCLKRSHNIEVVSRRVATNKRRHEKASTHVAGTEV